MTDFHSIVSLMGKVFDAIWGYNLVTVSGQHIRVGNIALAVILFMLGLKYSKNLSATVRRYIKHKMGSDKDAANAIEKLVIYILFCFYIVTILEIANVPLSTFAFIGGALAIGIGLGAQNIISNFISSLIIMVERPMKIGDIVEIEGVIGVVTSVGSRCIVVTNFSNVEVLIPNSKIMQNTLVNWTLSDNVIKFRVEIIVPKKEGVEFDHQQFMLDLTLLAKNFDFTLPDTQPSVFLTKVGSESLKFLLLLDCDILQLQHVETLKNTLNLSLLQNFSTIDFKVEFPKIVEVKPIEK
jgi:small-conductance mechanosensitive channel